MGKFFWVFIFFSLFGFAENFEIICEKEVLKEDFNVSIVKNSCLNTAQKYEKENNLDDASWFYLIADRQDKNIEYLTISLPRDAIALYGNIAHSCILRDKPIEGEKYYKKFLENYHNPNTPMQDDFKKLFKLYPKYKTKIIKAKKIWNRLYKPLSEIDDLYHKLENLEQGEESIFYLKKIIFIKERYLKNSISIASDYQSLAIVFEDRFSRYEEALTLYNKMLTIFLKHLGENYFDTATAYYNIANIYNTQGHYKKALQFYQRVLKIDLKIFGEEHLETGATYHNMGNVCANIGNFTKAFNFYNKSLSIDLKVLKDKEHEHIRATYHEMANLLTYQGKYNEALALYFKVLKMDLKKEDSKQIGISTLYHNIANIFKDKGEYHKSLEYYNKALKITMELYGEHHASTITTLHNIAYVHHYLGDYEKALKIYMKVLEYDFIIFGLHHPHTAITYHHIAYIYQDKKMHSEALEIYNMSLDITEKILGEHHINTASTHQNIATILEELGAYSEALLEYNKALKVQIDILGENHPTTTNTYNNIATVFQSQKLYSKSLTYYHKALSNNLKNLKKDHPSIAINYHNIGISHFYKKNYQEAYNATKKSFDIFLTNRKNNIRNLDSFEKKKFLNHNRDIMRISHLFRTAWFHPNKTIGKNSFNTWLNYKGTLFEYQNILSMLKSNPKTPKIIIKKINDLNMLNNQLSNTKNKEEIKEIEEKIHKVEIELSKKNDSLKSILKLNELNSTQIANHLKPHQLYIDFARGNDNYYIFTLDNKNNISFQQIDENQTKAIDTSINAYQKNTQGMAKKITKKILTKEYRETSKKEAKTVLTKLYNNIVDSYLKELIKGKTHLTFSPDGLMNYFPFEALYHQDKYLIEDYTINYISSGKEFVRQTKIKEKKPINKMTIFANANFNALVKDSIFPDEPKTKTEKSPLKPLGDREIKIIQKYYKKPLIFDANSSTLYNLVNMPSSKIIHISTHGEILKDTSILNPMRKAVLYFAGANVTSKKGRISALKLSSMDFKDTELVVLSACESGRGSIQNAEGVVGLPKALLQAGVRNVIMSLWTVSNEKTATLMDTFYANISHKQSYNMALQNAKREMIKTHPHPYYWSAFILNGL